MKTLPAHCLFVATLPALLIAIDAADATQVRRVESPALEPAGASVPREAYARSHAYAQPMRCRGAPPEDEVPFFCAPRGDAMPRFALPSFTPSQAAARDIKERCRARRAGLRPKDAARHLVMLAPRLLRCA